MVGAGLFSRKRNNWLNKKKIVSDFIQQKQYTQAIPILEKLLQTNYSTAEKIYLYNTLGECYENIARYDLAMKTYNKAQQIGKNNLRTVLNRAQLYQKIDSFPEAIDNYKKVLKKQPKNFSANFGLGELYQKQMLYKEAKFYYFKALKLNPEDEETAVNLALVYEKEGNIDLAVQQLKKVNKESQPIYFLYLGKLYLYNNQPTLAIESLKQAQNLELNQTYRCQLHLLLGLSYLAQKKLALAETEFRTISASNSETGLGYFFLGLIEYGEKNFSQATENWQLANQKSLPALIKEALNSRSK